MPQNKVIIYNDTPVFSFLTGSNFEQEYKWQRPGPGVYDQSRS